MVVPIDGCVDPQNSSIGGRITYVISLSLHLTTNRLALHKWIAIILFAVVCTSLLSIGYNRERKQKKLRKKAEEVS
jgi:hypothetical protein